MYTEPKPVPGPQQAQRWLKLGVYSVKFEYTSMIYVISIDPMISLKTNDLEKYCGTSE